MYSIISPQYEPMKILQIHKFFSKQRGGGSVTSLFEMMTLLERKGHKMMIFSMKDPTNEPSPYEKYFVSHYNVNDGNVFDKMRLVPRIIHNKEAAEKMEELLHFEKPDIAHLHNFYNYLTPSILPVLKKYRIPIVHKLSNYKILCPNYKLFTQGDVCMRCKGGKYYNAIIHRCLKNSYAKSAVGAMEAYIHAWKDSYDTIDLFLAPSDFMKNMCVSFGIPEKKIVLLRNVLNFSAYVPVWEKEPFILYMGRLSEEKGLYILIDAIKILHDRGALHGHILKIAGKGPEEEKLQKYTRESGCSDKIEFVGFVENGSDRWKNLLSKAHCSVLPSLWWDNSPIAVSESMAFGTPVIVSDRGGTKEQVEDGKSGMIFRSTDSHSLANKIEEFLSDSEGAKEMSRKAREYVYKMNNEEQYYEELMKIYQSLV